MTPQPNTFVITNGNILKQSYDPELDRRARETYEAYELWLLEKAEAEKRGEKWLVKPP